ncbi:hypothetical protein EP7_002220 [Isosphaeraceae bacterium EP7]
MRRAYSSDLSDETWAIGEPLIPVHKVVDRPAGVKGFVLLHHRRVAERTIAWLGRSRRNSRGHERRVESSEAIIKVCLMHSMLILLNDNPAESIACSSPRKPKMIAG